MRYRVEVDQTLTYEVEVDADTVEDGLAHAVRRVKEVGWPWLKFPVTGNNVVARDSVEEPDDELPELAHVAARCPATRNDSQCVYYGTHTLPHRAYDAHRSEFTWLR